mmetsp:Transcript_27100/g.33643  ORF Transcript_27100/g.33643 Transcript_27100/m.33643 type:complete len:83 (-) Transcript_27100:208-456(-)
MGGLHVIASSRTTKLEGVSCGWLLKEERTSGNVWLIADCNQVTEEEERRLRNMIEAKTAGRIKAEQLHKILQDLTVCHEEAE